MAGTELKEGDKAHAEWGGGEVGGTVVETKSDGPLEIESKGKTVSKKGESDNAAVHLKRSGNDVVKKDSELTKDADGGKSKASEDKKSDAKESDEKESEDKQGDAESKKKSTEQKKGEEKDTDKKTDKEAETGDKRKKSDSEKKSPAPKKAKKDEDAKTSEKAETKPEGEKKKQGRPPKGSENGNSKAKKDVPPTTRTTRSSSGKSQK